MIQKKEKRPHLRDWSFFITLSVYIILLPEKAFRLSILEP
jgi:hypothetical protein